MHAPAGRSDQPAHHFDGGGLASPVGSEEAHDLTTRHGETEIFNSAYRCSLPPIVDLAQLSQLESKRPDVGRLIWLLRGGQAITFRCLKRCFSFRLRRRCATIGANGTCLRCRLIYSVDEHCRFVKRKTGSSAGLAKRSNESSYDREHRDQRGTANTRASSATTAHPRAYSTNRLAVDRPAGVGGVHHAQARKGSGR